MTLQEKINNINSYKLKLFDYNLLLDIATKQKEFTTTVFIYDHMLENNIQPNDYTFKLINRLHSKTIPENNSIRLPLDIKRRLEPRRRIHKIMKGYNYSEKYNKAKEYIPKVIELLNKNNEFKNYHKIKLAKLISKELKIDQSLSKVIVTYLKRHKLVKCDKSLEINKNVFRHFYSNVSIEPSGKIANDTHVNISKNIIKNNNFKKLSKETDIRNYFKW